MKKFVFVVVLVLGAFMGSASVAETPDPNTVHAVAIVNDQVISSTDLHDRIKLVLFAAGLPDTEEVRQKITPQVVHMLVDEALQMQEGTKNDIKVTEADIKKAEAYIEQRNGHPVGSMQAELERRDIPKLAFYNQLRAQLTWTKLLQKTAKPKIHISDEDVERASHKAADSPATGGQVQISVIRLSTDSPKAEKSSQVLAEKLYSEIKNGASFEKVAGQFGGDSINKLWVDEAQIDPALSTALKSIEPGSITTPVKTQNGIQIVKLEGRRGQGSASAAATSSGELQNEAELAIRQITLTLKPDAKTQEAVLMLDIAKNVARNPGTCFDKNVAGVENLSDMDIKVTYVRKFLSKLSPEIRKVIENVDVGGISAPYASPAGIELYMVCERTNLADVPKSLDAEEKDRVRQELYGEKMDLEAQKYMRNLRRDAYIDVRL